MSEFALFETALRATVPVVPDPRLGRDLVPRLAQAARAASIEAETQASRRGPASGGRRRARSRRALVARVGIAVGLIPLVLAGLASAGVTVPPVARDAFHSLRITLPNQPSEGDQKATTESQGGGNDVSDAAKGAKDSERGNSAAAHEHARQQREKAHGNAVGHDRGKAYGLKDLAPPSQSGEAGPPEHSNAGGSGQSQSSHPAPRVQSRPFPPVISRDRSSHP